MVGEEKSRGLSPRAQSCRGDTKRQPRLLNGQTVAEGEGADAVAPAAVARFR